MRSLQRAREVDEVTGKKLKPLKSCVLYGFSSSCSRSEAWDIAFAEVMLFQQTRIANLLAAVETERQKAQDAVARYAQYDPFNMIGYVTSGGRVQCMTIISQLREQEEQTIAARNAERDAVVLELRNTLRNLLDEMRDGDGVRASEYEKKIHRYHIPQTILYDLTCMEGYNINLHKSQMLR